MDVKLLQCWSILLAILVMPTVVHGQSGQAQAIPSEISVPCSLRIDLPVFGDFDRGSVPDVPQIHTTFLKKNGATGYSFLSIPIDESICGQSIRVELVAKSGPEYFYLKIAEKEHADIAARGLTQKSLPCQRDFEFGFEGAKAGVDILPQLGAEVRPRVTPDIVKKSFVINIQPEIDCGKPLRLSSLDEKGTTRNLGTYTIQEFSPVNFAPVMGGLHIIELVVGLVLLVLLLSVGSAAWWIRTSRTSRTGAVRRPYGEALQPSRIEDDLSAICETMKALSDHIGRVEQLQNQLVTQAMETAKPDEHIEAEISGPKKARAAAAAQAPKQSWVESDSDPPVSRTRVETGPSKRDLDIEAFAHWFNQANGSDGEQGLPWDLRTTKVNFKDLGALARNPSAKEPLVRASSGELMVFEGASLHKHAYLTPALDLTRRWNNTLLNRWRNFFEIVGEEPCKLGRPAVVELRNGSYEIVTKGRLLE